MKCCMYTQKRSFFSIIINLIKIFICIKINMNNSIQFNFLFILMIIKLALFDDKLSYYKKEYDDVLELCKKDLNCKSQLTNSSNNIYNLLEPYYEEYWKGIHCQRENEPCGNNWGFCCHQLECQYILNDSIYESLLSEKIGLCSLKNSTYIIPNH